MTKRNMYGCLPCPDCGSVYCTPYRGNAKHVHESLRQFDSVIECGDCGRQASADFDEDGDSFTENGKGVVAGTAP
jgi:ribosomal protein S27E